jgi:transposase
MIALFWRTDEQWATIEPHLPPNRRKPERVNDRRVISGIPHVLKTGCRWRDCPYDYTVPPATVYNRFNLFPPSLLGEPARSVAARRWRSRQEYCFGLQRKEGRPDAGGPRVLFWDARGRRHMSRAPLGEMLRSPHSKDMYRCSANVDINGISTIVVMPKTTAKIAIKSINFFSLYSLSGL